MNAFWCDRHEEVELADNIDHNRREGCWRKGPFYDADEAQKYGMAALPTEAQARIREAIRQKDRNTRQVWNDLLADIDL